MSLRGQRDRRGESESRPVRSAYDKALGLLARREQSRRELDRKLRQAGYAGTEVEGALDRLQAEHYQDDGRFAEALARSFVARGYGPLRVAAELKTHGVSAAAARELLAALDADWPAVAAAALRRRGAGPAPGDRAERARRAQFLLRRGFAAATVRAVTQAEVDPSADPDS